MPGTMPTSTGEQVMAGGKLGQRGSICYFTRWISFLVKICQFVKE